MMTLTTAVTLIIFNRPEHTARIFAEIAKAKPQKLLVISDGPRVDRPGEGELCAAARAVIEQVDWDCEVLTNYADQNLGCGLRVSSGINWVFEQVEEAIILEDDCLPHPTFFRFCEEMLARYRYEERVMMISGNNFASVWETEKSSYHFSKFPATWGWATWRRSWRHYTFSIKYSLNRANKQKVYDFLEDRRYYNLMITKFQQVLHNEVTTWDYQWAYACFIHNGLTIIPALNLVSNIGFGGTATHTTTNHILSALPMFALQFPLIHPKEIKVNEGYDRQNFLRWGNINFRKRTINNIKKFGKRILHKIGLR